MVISQFPAKFGKYILLDRLNAGGMAEVFRAKVTGAEKFERLVAIKCMLPQLLADDRFISMFIDEAKLAAQLNHANIVQIYELGRFGERLYIAMELVHGRDLRHVIRTARAHGIPIPLGFAAYVISRAASGLDFAHHKAGIDGQRLNLVHRDVSPQNILVSYDGEVKVVDFGIAKAEARNTETQAGVLKGKFAYMAPEQVMGTKIDRRTDIFALGSVLYEVMSGQRLFTGDTDLSVLEKVRAAKIPDIRTVLPAEGEALEPVLMRALAKHPQDRYTHAAEMAEDLEQLLIEDRSIFGTKRAAQFMQLLYADEVVQLQENIRRYAEVNTENCTVVLGEDAAGTPESVVFNAAHEADNDAASWRTKVVQPPRGARRQGGPDTKARKRTERTSTGVSAVSRVAPRRVGPGRPSMATSVHQPGEGRPSQVLRTLRLALVLSAFITAVLVIAVYLKAPAPSRPNPIQQIKEIFQKVPEPFASFIPGEPPLPAPEQDIRPLADDGDIPDIPDNGRVHYGWVVLRNPPTHGRVYIDGVYAGALPLQPRRLKVGPHEIKIVDEDGATQKSAFSVKLSHTRKLPKTVTLP